MAQVERVAEEDVLPAPVRQSLVVTWLRYLVTGSRAAFQHHRWLFPTPGAVAL
ncbi:MAG: hypothetical protein SXV54_27465 [Chloroflexota bacterium]|nr:hypothetical protein [Chloroflexota bacterium]